MFSVNIKNLLYSVENTIDGDSLIQNPPRSTPWVISLPVGTRLAIPGRCTIVWVDTAGRLRQGVIQINGIAS